MMQLKALAWLVVVIDLLVVGGSVRSAAQGNAVQENKDVVPAAIVSEMRLGPAAGNGTHPFAAAFDSRRNRLFVLNQVPQCLSIVDVENKRVVDVVPLAEPFDGWGNSDPFLAMTYDAKADVILIAKGNYSLPCVIIAVAAATHKVAVVRTFEERGVSKFAFNARRGEVYAASSRQIQVLDSRSLAIKRTLLTDHPIQVMAASVTTGQLYTVEVASSDTARNGKAGRYSATRIVVRDPASGQILSRSPDTFPYPHSLLVDDAHRRLYLVHGNVSEGQLYASFEPTTITILAQSTLKRERRVRYPAVSQKGQLLVLGNPILDTPRSRLITDLYSNGNLVVLNLIGTPHALMRPVEGSLYSNYRLGAVLPQTGQTVLLIDNAMRLLNSRTFKPDAAVTLGVTVNALFADREAHRLLAYVDRNVHEFLMLSEGQVQRLFKSYLLPQTHLLTVDFARKVIYHVYADGWGSGVFLNGTDFSGRQVAMSMKSDGEYAGLIITQTPSRILRLLFPAYPESVRAVSRRSLDIVVGDREIHTVPVEMPRSLMPPQQLLYAPAADRAYIFSELTLTAYSGKDLASLGAISLSALADHAARWPRLPSESLAVDETGKFGYYADAMQKQIVKFLLTDGSVIARRSLLFTPAMPVVDSAVNRLYLVDVDGGRIVEIASF